MRFLFITHGIEPASFQGPHWLPLGFAYIGALLKQHRHEVLVFDRYAAINRLGQNAEKIDQAMLDTVNDFQPDIIGLNTVSPMIYDTVHCARIIRNIFSSMMLAGGHHATALPLLTLEKIPELDGVGIGEGEESLLELAGGKKPEEIRGFIWRKSPGKESFGRMEELDKLPFPDFSLFDTNFYTRRASSTIRGFHLSTLSMLGSRGCLHRCSFCTESLTYGHGVRFHSMEYVTEMVNKTLKQYPHVEGIYFHDNDFLISSKRAVQICEGLMASGLQWKLKWAIQTRADRLTPEIAGLLKRAGCICVEIGVEAAAQKELDAVGKRTTVSVNETAIAICRSMDLSVHAYMLTGFEAETIADLSHRLEWVKKVRPTSFSWHPIQIHPGSPLYLRKGISFFEEEDWTEENVFSYYQRDHLSPIPAGQRDAWMKEHYEPFGLRFARLNLLRSNPPWKLSLLLWDDLKRLWRGLRTRTSTT